MGPGLDTRWPATNANGNQPEPLPSADDFEANERYLRTLTKRILLQSDDFYSYEKPTDFRLTSRVVPGERSARNSCNSHHRCALHIR